MANQIERMASVGMALAAFAFATVLVRREFFPRPSIVVIKGGESSFVPNWSELLSVGRRMGDSAAPIKLIEFADLECPFCRGYDQSLEAIQKKYPEVEFVFVHFPLSIHRFARPAARALECAGAQGRFRPMLSVIYAKQDSFGLLPWSEYARKAGVVDEHAFAKCVDDQARVSSVEAGVDAGGRFDIRGTPTIILNGWRFGSAPSAVDLVSAIEALRAGRQPYPSFPKEALSARPLK